MFLLQKKFATLKYISRTTFDYIRSKYYFDDSESSYDRPDPSLCLVALMCIFKNQNKIPCTMSLRHLRSYSGVKFPEDLYHERKIKISYLNQLGIEFGIFLKCLTTTPRSSSTRYVYNKF